ncbi:MAG: conjugal transfer protein TrbC [Nitrospirales bacterium]|nr:conjugal transfer protein TrbC [Nitrospirales bacterium]
MKKHLVMVSLWGLVMFLSVDGVMAATTTGMPWESRLNTIVNSVTGPVAWAIGVFAIIAAGFGLGFSEGGGAMGKILWMVLGLSIAFNAVTWGLPFFGFTQGAMVP